MQDATKKAPSPEMLDIYRELFPNWSPRAVARFFSAMQILDEIGYQRDDVLELLREATRADRTISISLVEELANAAKRKFVQRRPAVDAAKEPS
jgi:hypothetical protein